MFTGIIESLGTVSKIWDEQGNRHFIIESDISNELTIDQSVSHNGVCLTVVARDKNAHTVTAIRETLEISNLNELSVGDVVNLERCMANNGRFDGHIVQGHVDTSAICNSISETEGSWQFDFEYQPKRSFLTVEKGSICVNGISLTVINSKRNSFSVAIIPYTYENTNFKNLQIGKSVNLEFDIIGKYIEKIMGQDR